MLMCHELSPVRLAANAAASILTELRSITDEIAGLQPRVAEVILCDAYSTAQLSRFLSFAANVPTPHGDFALLIAVLRLPTICLKLKEQRTLSCGLARGLCATCGHCRFRSGARDLRLNWR